MVLFGFALIAKAQNKEEGTGKDYVQQFAMRQDPDLPSGPNKDVEEVKIVKRGKGVKMVCIVLKPKEYPV